MRNAFTSLALITAVALAAGCAARATGSRPDDMSLAGHKRAAQKERAESKRHADRYDPDAARSVGGGGQAAADAPDWTDHTYNPTAIHLQHAQLHKEHAHQHEAAAKALASFEAKECKKFQAKTRAQCPLVQVTRSEAIPGGVRMHFAKEVALQAVIEHARCHHAFGRTQGHTGMNACPLYLKSIEISRATTGHAIELTTSQKEQVKELRRRAQLHIVSGSDAAK